MSSCGPYEGLGAGARQNGNKLYASHFSKISVSPPVLDLDLRILSFELLARIKWYSI